MSQQNGSQEGGAGSLNDYLQDDKAISNDTHVVTIPVETSGAPLNDSVDSTRTSTSLLSSTVSVCSESNLLVPNKLFTDISSLKTCYIGILKEVYTNIHPKSKTVSDGDILLLTHEQLVDGCKQNKMKADELRRNLVAVLDCVGPVCVPHYQSDTRPKRSPIDLQLINLSKNMETLSSQNQTQFETLKSELEKLTSTVSNYEISLSSSPTILTQTEQLISIPTDTSPPELDLPYINHTVDDFMAQTECDELKGELMDLPFSRERGRLTMKFGEYYSYNGSRGESTVEFPPHLKVLLDKLNDQFVSSDNPLLNSCVVNKYVGPDSYIGSHSDDEKSIHPESHIFTVSIGREATVHFTDIGKSETHQHIAKNGSLYSMSRQSQGCYRHKINKDSSWTGDDVRLSLTFRSVHWRNNNSTIVLGDSNTGGLKFACFGKNSPTDYNGTFGNALPGKKEQAFVVDQIDAAKCVGYNNIVVHCGINDVRKPEIESEEHVRDIYVQLKSKINHITHLNKKARVFVSLLLPTKLDNVNRKVKIFNKLIVDDLCKSFHNRVKCIDSYRKLCDSNGLLARNLSRDFTRDNQPDNLHLNDGGLKLLSVSIKNALFLNKRQGEGTRRSGEGRTGSSDQQPDSEGYAGAVSHPPRRGRRGGYNRRGRGNARRS